METTVEPQTDEANAAPQAAPSPPPTTEPGRPDIGPELSRLVLLTTKYPEVGPPLAELAFKAGFPEHGNQILKMALDGEAPSIEYFFVAAKNARLGRRYDEALRSSVDAVRAFAAAPGRYAEADDGAKLLHLVRSGFSTLLFDMKDLNGNPAFIEGLAGELPKLAVAFDADPFYHSLLAQVHWFSDRAASERSWDAAAERGEPEFTWNARGTWYKEAENDIEKAENAYRQGLERVPQSPLLAHNLAQLLLDRAGPLKDERPDLVRRMIHEGETLVRIALQGDCPGGLRRHIYSTRAELAALRNTLRARSSEEEVRPKAPPPKIEVGQVLRGRVSSLTAFGVFVHIGGGLTGLLHKSELAHEHVADPSQLVQIGDEIEVKIIDLQEREGTRPRVGLSRRALLPAPPPASRPERSQDRPQERRPERRPDRRPDASRDAASARPAGRPDDRRDHPSEDRRPRRAEAPQPRPEWRPADSRLASLGEMLLAKIKEQEGKG